MSDEQEDNRLSRLAFLRAPFPAHQISKLPKGTKAQNDCPAEQKINCTICGGWHHPKIKHLDYVGHASITDRLLDVDPAWSWEPVAFDERGLPAFDAEGGLWIRLTVCGVTRLGYGNADNKPYMDAGARIKECIGDALRNAAMRGGAALELWHKGELHLPDEESEKETAEKAQEREHLLALLHAVSDEGFEAYKTHWMALQPETKKLITPVEHAAFAARAKEVDKARIAWSSKDERHDAGGG